MNLQQIKQRKVVQYAIAYLAVGAGVLQVLDILSNRFGWPDVVVRALTVVLAVGFFATVVLAWYHGDKGQQTVTMKEAVILGALALIAFAGVAFISRGDRGGAEHAVIGDASVAVLPFKNFSSDKEQEYFSDGITEEILNALAQVEGLKVAARTSSFAFKDKDVPVDEIASRLHVSNVLEGSVRKDGDRVRITAQLINAKTGYHVWSQTFDRPAKDVFAVQDEISGDVAQALQLRLTRSAATRTVSPEAHNEYLLGLFFWNRRTSSDLVSALAHFQKASKLQPDYAAAYAGEANTWAIVPTWVDSISGVFALPKAQTAADRALALDPTLPEAYAALGGYYEWLEYNHAKAEEYFKKAIALNPNYSTAYQWWGESYMGRNPARAVELLSNAAQRDPLSRASLLNLGHAYMANGDRAHALSTYEQTVALDSTWSASYRALAIAHLLYGDSTRALEAVGAMLRNTQARNELPDSTVVRGVFDPRFHAAAIARVQAFPNRVLSAVMFAMLHDRDDALARFESSIAWRQTNEQRFVSFPGGKWLWNDPQFIASVKKMNIEPPH